MKTTQKQKIKLADIFRILCTWASTIICGVTLIGIVAYVFIQGSSILSWDLLVSDYQEQMVTIRIDDGAGSYENPNREGEFFSYNYGLGLKNDLTTGGEASVVVSYIDLNSPFNHAVSNRTDEKIEIDLGTRLAVFTGLTIDDELVYTKNSDTAEEFASIMDQTVVVISVQCKVGGGGIRSSLITTLLLIVVTLLISLPFGIGASLYLVEFAKEGKVKKIIQTMIDMTSGIPSIIFGFCGALIFIPLVGNLFGVSGYTILAGALTMSIVLLPTIIKTTSESLMMIPKHYSMASFALGASKTQTVFKVILPNAMPGILTATLLSVGRIIGESAALIFVMGTAISDKVSILGSSTSLSLHMWSILGGENPNYKTACAISIIILIVVFSLSIIVKIISKKINKMEVQS